jgi:RNA polymerase subunit RPABC4/transcription elongation factor Spt4
MRKVPAVGIALVLLFMMLIPIASSAQAGDVTFSSDSIALSPASPVEGDDLSVTVTLTNAATSEATNVEVSLHPDDIANAAFHQQTVTIAADGFIQISATWTDLPFGSHSVVLAVTHASQSANVSKSIQVAGLADLTPSSVTVSPTTDLHQGDVVDLSVEVTNGGNLDAGASHLLIRLDGNLLQEMQVPALPAGQSTTMETSFNAPTAGQHQVTAFVNSQSSSDGVVESDVDNNELASQPFSVLADPDYLHHAQPNPQITVSTPAGALAGPWTLNGEILRMGGQGASSIDVAILRVEGQTETTVRTFSLSFSESSPLQSWQQVLTTTDLQISEAGQHLLRVRIDPSRQVPQSIQFNDDLDVSITKNAEPNVAVSPSASALRDTILPGESVTFEVTVTNIGVIAVIGSISATFDGQSLTPQQGLGIPSGEERTFLFSASASGDVNRVLSFTASWTANEGSFDSNLDDNFASGEVTLHSSLTLRFLQETESWTPSDTPLVYGTTYTYTIEVTSTEGSGDETFTCLDHLENRVLGTREISFSAVGERDFVICTFEADETGPFELYIVPTGGTVATWTASWTISATGQGEFDSDDNSVTQGAILFIFAAILLIAVLGAAFVLTRTSEDEAERETYEYCPSCDGEIEGDEELCPHCEFDLAAGQSQFHDCTKCNSNIPDLMEHCPYCGEVQNVSSYYERRERKERVIEEVAEEQVDWNEVVAGSDSFDETLEELGFDADQYESEWDSKLQAAEKDIDQAEEWRDENEFDEDDEESGDQIADTQLRATVRAHRADLDELIGDKKERRHLTDEQVDLTASDANIRSDIYELTGEEGVLPGEQVNVDHLPDHSIVGNELKRTEDVVDFSVEDEDSGSEAGGTAVSGDETGSRRRRAPRRKKDESTE